MKLDPNLNWLTRKQAATLLGVSENKIKHAASKSWRGNPIPKKSYGGSFMFGPKAALLNWFNGDLSIENKSAKSANTAKKSKLNIVGKIS